MEIKEISKVLKTFAEENKHITPLTVDGQLEELLSKSSKEDERIGIGESRKMSHVSDIQIMLSSTDSSSTLHLQVIKSRENKGRFLHV